MSPEGTGSNNTIMLCMEKNCCWLNFGCGLQNPAYRILVSLPAEAGNAQPSGEGIGVGKRVKEHNSKVQGPGCVGGGSSLLLPIFWQSQLGDDL